MIAIALNPDASFYAGFFFTIPAVLWYANRERYVPATWWAIGAVIAVVWLWDVTVFYYLPFLALIVGPLPDPWLAPVGLLALIWFGLELRDSGPR